MMNRKSILPLALLGAAVLASTARADAEPPFVVMADPAPWSTGAPEDTDIVVILADDLSGIDPASILLTVNQEVQYGIEVAHHHGLSWMVIWPIRRWLPSWWMSPTTNRRCWRRSVPRQ